MKTCTICKIQKDLQEFPNNKRMKDGKDSWCKSCHSLKDKERKERNRQLNLAGTPRIVRSEKKCSRCKEIKSVSEFPKVITTEDGFGPKCSKCNYKESYQWQKDNPEKRSLQSKRYEERYKDKRKTQSSEWRKKKSKEKQLLKEEIARSGLRTTKEIEILPEIQEEILTWEILEEREEDLTQYKTCSKCGLLKSLHDYYSHKQSLDGKKSWCKICHKNDRKIYRLKNYEYLRSKEDEWKKNNPLKTREHVMRRRARIKEVTVESVSYENILKRYGMWCYLCESVIEPKFKYPELQSLSFDHVIPLTMGGIHSESNIKPAHFGCNNKKNNRV